MDRLEQSIPTRDSLRKLGEEARQTRSLEGLREKFRHLQEMRRNSLDDFDLQVMIGDIHQEIVERARYLRGEESAPSASGSQSVIFQPVPAEKPPSPKPAVLEPDHPVDATAPLGDIPPDVTRVDAKSWQMILGLAAFLSVLVLVGFFYLIQTARKLNIDGEPQQPKTEQTEKSNAAAPAPADVPASLTSTPPATLSPTLRLYTDLAASLVTIDDQPPRDLTDGELMLENVAPGAHIIRVGGTSGSASFQFEVIGRNAPKVLGTPQASNALAVLVSQQDGRGQLVTSAGRAQVLLDGKSAGEAAAAGLELTSLGTTDHDLQVVREQDRQRFVLTYTSAPVLTAYVKSDVTSGILQILAGQDGASVYIDNTLARRKTDHGQLRLSIRAAKYSIRIHKDGFVDPPPAAVEVKKGELTTVTFQLTSVPDGPPASLQITGAQPGTLAYLDHELAATVGPDGAARIPNVKPGDHSIELRHEQATPKKLQRTLHAGEILLLTGADVTLEKITPEAKPTPPAAATEQDSAKTASPPVREKSIEGSVVRKGGGFINYDTPRAPGLYSFRTQGHVGGVLKKGKLQWYAGYVDSQNYVLFSVDGKRAEIREVRDGKSTVVNRIPFEVDSKTWIQVELSVRTNAIGARVKSADGSWMDMGAAVSTGRDFTQNKVGFYIPPNDEVTIANFKFATR